MSEYFNEENYTTNSFSSENIEKIVAKKTDGKHFMDDYRINYFRNNRICYI